ncbi:MAG: hypothetical protein PHV68_07265 [Candidatus Gastranaerophilales bacterium]|nr:hypothetical protein [Candidatus Gastranaerophilales bacterium]
MKKFNILKTFEIFNMEAISILREAIVRFMLIETDNFFKEENAMKATIDKNNQIDISIINKPKMYSLMTNVWYKKQRLEENENIQS